MNAINEAADASGLSLLSLVNAINEQGGKMTYPTLHRAQAGEHLPDYITLKQLRAIARACGLQASQLVELDEQGDPPPTAAAFPFKTIREKMGYTAQQVADKTGFNINLVFKAEQHGRAGVRYRNAFFAVVVGWFERQ